MDALRRMAIFARVVELGSMNAAAKALGMTPSAVSQHLSKLEAQHNVTLLHRTTRKLTLTEAGAVFYQGCADMLAAAQLAEQRITELRDAPVGELRLSAPTGFAGPLISQALAPLLKAHPQLSLRLFFHDEMIDLVGNRIDLALRAGELKDSSLVARHLADWPNVLVAAPQFLARIAPIAHPSQLAEQQWIGIEAGRSDFVFIHPNGERCQPTITPRIVSNNIVSAREFVLAGMGLAIQPEPEVRTAINDGRLMVVLPEWRLPSIAIYAVTPRREAQPAKVRYAIEALKAQLAL
ncbi:LysR family transcriptional regulator [Chitinibacter bivalviorum]|uniref:LysR family transcriptional regulator n=1 Tax=Chitinibacter bivalviorum TaxID=2739434 RepID=A0A7H9BKF1_9NEIS|nr:LysR family transcriptional regulator [Chitinibacter bivalviorum]QLG89155.1 LysR family transcriptional regulator [Chitinibacter bivalviorum]